MLQKVQHRVIEVWNIMHRHYPSLTAPHPIASINARLKTTAGMAYIHNRKLEFSRDLLAEHPEEFHKIIIPHEVCHQVAFDLYGDRGHGKHWKAIMVKYGIPPDTYHKLINTKWEARKAGML